MMPPRKVRYTSDRTVEVEDAWLNDRPAIKVYDLKNHCTYLVQIDPAPGLLDSARIRTLVSLPDPGYSIPRSAPLGLLGRLAFLKASGASLSAEKPLTREGRPHSGRGREYQGPPPRDLAEDMKKAMTRVEMAEKYGVTEKAVDKWVTTFRKQLPWFPTRQECVEYRRRRERRDKLESKMRQEGRL